DITEGHPGYEESGESEIIPNERLLATTPAPGQQKKEGRMNNDLSAFDTTLQTTHIWLNELTDLTGWRDNRHRAYLALRAVLHALRDRLSVDDAAALGA